MAQEDQERPLPRSEAIHLRLNEKMVQMSKLIEDYKDMMARVSDIFEKADNGEDVTYKSHQLAHEYSRFEKRRTQLQLQIRHIIHHQLQK